MFHSCFIHDLVSGSQVNLMAYRYEVWGAVGIFLCHASRPDFASEPSRQDLELDSGSDLEVPSSAEENLEIGGKIRKEVNVKL